MIVTATLSIGASTTLPEAAAAARILETAGVAALAVVDAAGSGAERAPFEATTLCAYLARRTDRIGVVASNSALYGFPYHAARRLSTIDHFAHGRAGWLLRSDTAAAEARAYDWRSTLGREDELHRATEFAEIAYELWNSWDEGAKWPDKASGDYKDDSGVHPIDYRSTSFRVRGPLDVPPSPQGRPVVLTGITTAAEAAHLTPYADVAIVTAAGRAAAAELIAAVRRVGLASGTSPLVLLSIEATSADPAALGDLVADLGVDGVAVSGSLDADDASAVATVAAALGVAPADASAGGGPTLATTLGIAGIMTHGGRAA